MYINITNFSIVLNRKLLRIKKYEVSDLRALTLLHRQLQIIGIHYRLNLSQFQIGCAILSFIVMQLACLYNSIFFLSGKDTGGPIWYDLLYGWSEVGMITGIIIVFGMLADVYNASQRFQMTIHGRHDLKRNKWFRKWFKSCPVFRIYFGMSNYLDRLTPLNIQDFAVNQTVSLMLLQN